MILWNIQKKKQQMKRARAKANQKRRRKRRYDRISNKSIAAVFMLCFVTSILLSQGAAAGESDEISVQLKAENVSIIQGEAKPVFTAVASSKGNVDTKLDPETGYTIKDLLAELNQGIGYALKCEGDAQKEGKYPIKVELTSEITTPLYSTWFGKVRIDLEDGTFEVKNQYGEWDGNKFKRWDGAYVKKDFITYEGKTYYFDKSGNKVAGWQEIDKHTYYFSKQGVMKTGWFKDKDQTYYFDENGMMHIGWLRLDGEQYYFDKKGKMVTGEKEIGSRKCVFGKDGKLESAEGGVDPDLPMVALTFDDGPASRTDDLLDALEENHARATFFMLGQNVDRYEATVNRMMEIGCELGNHSYNHPDLATLDAAGIQKQINTTSDLIAEAAGQGTTLVRPPYGSINETVKQNVGKPIILWSIDTLDWKTRNKDATIETVMAQVQDGDIILMHDIHSATIDAAIELIPMLQKEGYQLVTVSEMAEARGITMEAGEKYGEFPKDQE